MAIYNFEEKLKKKKGDKYEILSEYKNMSTKIVVKCKTCGYIFEKRPDVLLKGAKGCPVCDNGELRTTKDFYYYIKYNTNGNFELMSEYNGKENEVTIKHKDCNHTFTVLAKTFIKNKKCYHCFPCKTNGGSGRYAKSKEQYLKEVNDKFGDGWVLLDDYKGTTKKIRHQHSCGFIINTPPNVFINNKYNCPNCNDFAKGRLKSNEMYIEQLYKEFNGEYEAVDNYVNATTKIKVKHNCGCVFEVSPHKLFTRHTLCPMCNSSKGESKILSFLLEHDINFKKEYCIDGCKNKRTLIFDFAIFDNNNKLKMLIEYDGEQHFRPVDYFGGQKGYEETIKRDEIKNEFCQNNNILLLRIKYTDFGNLDKILSEYLL